MTNTTLIAGVVAAATMAACKTSSDVSALRGDTATDDAAIIEEVRAALKEGGCLGCHSEVGPSDFRQWALSTKNTAERLSSQEADTDFNPVTFGPKGVYRAYPEYFKRFFASDDKFQEFSDNLRPDPGMRVKGTGDKQMQRFEAIRDSMLKLAKNASGAAGQCVTKISAPMREHIKDMQTTGWAAKLLTGDNGGQSSFQSYGCPADTIDPLKCLSDVNKFKPHPEFVSSDVGVPGTRVVEVANVGSTFYWTRSSADGRFVGNGGQGDDAHVDDLQDSIRYYIANKSYDPGFFPDNSGFTIHGNPAIFCSMGVLRPDDQRNPSGTTTVGGKPWKTVTIDPEAPHNKALCLVDNGGPTAPDGSNNGDNTIPTYQSVGSGQGTRAYVLTGSHETDAGDIRDGVGIAFSGDLSIYELKRNAAGGYDRISDAPTEFQIPGEGDYSLTPSTQYIVGRVAGLDSQGAGKQLGYRLRSLANMMAQGSSYNKDTDPTVTSVCLEGSGSKPLASLDERFLTFHQYNPAKESSDIYVIDLMQEGRVYRVTEIPQGRQALFAHFRADGWLYFLVAAGGGWSNQDAYVMASDVAIRIAEGGNSANPTDDLEINPNPGTVSPQRPGTPATGTRPATQTSPRP